jgi:periplasmic protein TonB
MSLARIHRPSRVLPLLLLVAMAACSKDEPAAPSATPAQPAASSTAATPPAPAVSAEVQAMNVDQLRESATNALRENRIYAPGGNNAMEYYLALRDKLPNDAGVTSALTDLMPYTLIAAEQSIAREEFAEAQRLSTLIEKADPTAPALPRLKQSIAAAQQAVEQRAVTDEAKTQAELDARAKEQQRLAQQAEQQKAAEAVAAQQLAQQEAARAEAERQAAAQREATAQREAANRSTAPASSNNTAAPATARPAAAAPTLRAVSTPAPRYPPDALRSGTSGEVLVEITVGTDGSVTNARVVRATPARVFDREALNAVRRWRFEPIDEPITTRRTIGFNPG